MPGDVLVNQQRFFRMVDEIEDYAIILLDREGNIETWNKGAGKIKGYAASEVIGRNFSIFYLPEDLAINLPTKLIEQAALEGKVQYEGWRVRKDGSCFWGNLLITAIHDDAGDVIGFTKIMRDLTSVKLNQEFLRKSEDRYMKMIQEVVDYAIILLDREGTIENWNKGAEKIKGYTSEQIVGKNFRIFYTESDQKDRVPETLIANAALNGRAQLEGWRVRKDGSLFWGLISVTALHNEQGDVIGFSKVTRDLTERIIAEKTQKRHVEEIEKKNKELEQFTYITSHDLQEPLRTISSFNEFLQEKYYEEMDDEGRMFLDMIGQSAERMRNLIYSILDYSRIGNKRQVDKAIDCNIVLENLKTDLFKLIAESGATIHYWQLPVIAGYKMEILQLFQNIIGNAIKYRKKDVPPEITVTAETKEEHWLFSIKDNGIGMDPKYIHKIFQIFQRLHNRDDYEGNGIGLANCKKIIDLHGGEIRAESVLGEGSTFYFTVSKHLS